MLMNFRKFLFSKENFLRENVYSLVGWFLITNCDWRVKSILASLCLANGAEPFHAELYFMLEIEFLTSQLCQTRLRQSKMKFVLKFLAGKEKNE